MTSTTQCTDPEPASQAPKPARSRAASLLKLALAVVLLAWLARSGRLDARAFALDARAWLWILAAALLQGAMIATMGARWKSWLQLFPLSRGGSSEGTSSACLSWRETMVVAARGACAGVWTPAGLGMDGIRAAHALRRFRSSGPSAASGPSEPSNIAAGFKLLRSGAPAGIGRAVALASLLDRLVALAILGALCLPFIAARAMPHTHGVAATTFGLLALLLSAIAAVAWRKAGARASGALSAAAWTVATHLANVAAMGAVLEALAPQVAPLRALEVALEVAPVIILSSALPLTPLGLGVADATGEALLRQHGLSCGGEMVMLGRVVWLGVCLLAGIAFWLPDTARERS